MPTMPPEAANRPKPKVPYAENNFMDLPKPVVPKTENRKLLKGPEGDRDRRQLRNWPLHRARSRTRRRGGVRQLCRRRRQSAGDGR